MLNKRAAAEQLRKYATVARLIREQRMMQKRAEQLGLRPNSFDTDNLGAVISSKNDKPLLVEGGKQNPLQKRVKAWQRKGLKDTRPYQPGDWWQWLWAQPIVPSWAYEYYYPMPNHFHTPRE